jgi:hypothetical protein
MGLEARCEIRWRGHVWTSTVHLDSQSVEVRGRPRLVLPLKQIRRVEVADTELELETIDGRLTLVLGAATRTWARKIQAPPSRLTKLGIRAEQRVALLGLDDPEFRAELDAAGARVSARGRVDVVLLAVDAASDLERLRELRTRIEPDGAIWVIRVKGKAASVKEDEVRQAAEHAGLVDVKVASFSASHTAEKLVIPSAERSTAAADVADGAAPRRPAKKPGAPAGKKPQAAASRAAAKKTARRRRVTEQE